MINISFFGFWVAITVAWIIARGVIALRTKHFSLKRELQLLLVYGCIILVSRFVYFPLHPVKGRIDYLRFDSSRIFPIWHNFELFTFTHDFYDGWKTNVIGNILLFVPVGIVWPICFKKLDNIWKVTLAGFIYTLLIELTQLPFYDRCSDVDDMILNTTGVFLGALIYFAIKKCKGAKAGR